MTKKKEKPLSIEEEFTAVQEECLKYGYNAFLRFGEIHIRTKYESWYFVPMTNKTVRLMHGNNVGCCPSGWHTQFSRKISYQDLLTYIHQHEAAKFTNQFVDFSFTKTGGLKTAIA